MKRMNNLKNVIAAKIMGGLVIGMTAVAGVAPVTVFAQSQDASVRKSALRIPPMRNVQYAFMITMSARVWTHMQKVQRNVLRQPRKAMVLLHRMEI